MLETRMSATARNAGLLLAAVVINACTATTPTDVRSSTTLPAATTAPAAPSTSSPASTDDSPEIVVPEAHGAPVIDGILGSDEWALAATFAMSDGAPLQAMHYGDSLYLAVDGEGLGAINLVLGTDEEIHILHSSAALGSALYHRSDGLWQLSHGFSWCCRDRDDDSARLALLDEEGWQANIGFTGDPGVVEYQIEFGWQGSAMVVSSIRDEGDFGVWPMNLPADVQLQLIGEPPDTRSYDTALWPVLTTGT
jgi:hypothetical protein